MKIKTGEKVKIQIGPYSSLTYSSAIILEEIGYGFLVKFESGKYGSVHYDFCGKLYASRLYDNENDARIEAEKNKYMMS